MMNIMKPLTCVVAATAVFTSVTCAVSAEPVNQSPACAAPVVAAHRGGNYFTQSTARNFTASAAAGARVWETDVRFDRNNVPFLLHDPDLGSFGAPGLNIAAATGAQVDALRAPDGSTVETLYDLEQQILHTPGQTALIELKVRPTSAQWTLVDARVKPVASRVWIASFDPAVVRAAARRGYQTAQIDRHATPRGAAAVRALGTAYESEWSRLTASYVAQLATAGVSTYTYTVDTPAEWAHALTVGAVPLTDDVTGYLDWYRTVGCTMTAKDDLAPVPPRPGHDRAVRRALARRPLSRRSTAPGQLEQLLPAPL